MEYTAEEFEQMWGYVVGIAADARTLATHDAGDHYDRSHEEALSYFPDVVFSQHPSAGFKERIELLRHASADIRYTSVHFLGEVEHEHHPFSHHNLDRAREEYERRHKDNLEAVQRRARDAHQKND